MYKEKKLGIIWEHDNLFPLRRVFFKAVYGNLEARMLYAASKGNTPEMFKWLRRGADIEIVGENALKIATINGHINTVKYLIQSGVSREHLPKSSLSTSKFKTIS